jgi:hypothetical protein
MIMSQVTRRNPRKEKNGRRVAKKNHQKRTKRRNARRMIRRTKRSHHNNMIRTITLAVRRVEARKRIVKSAHQRDIHRPKKSLSNNKATLHQWKKFVSNSI